MASDNWKREAWVQFAAAAVSRPWSANSGEFFPPDAASYADNQLLALERHRGSPGDLQRDAEVSCDRIDPLSHTGDTTKIRIPLQEALEPTSEKTLSAYNLLPA